MIFGSTRVYKYNNVTIEYLSVIFTVLYFDNNVVYAIT